MGCLLARNSREMSPSEWSEGDGTMLTHMQTIRTSSHTCTDSTRLVPKMLTLTDP